MNSIHTLPQGRIFRNKSRRVNGQQTKYFSIKIGGSYRQRMVQRLRYNQLDWESKVDKKKGKITTHNSIYIKTITYQPQHPKRILRQAAKKPSTRRQIHDGVKNNRRTQINKERSYYDFDGKKLITISRLPRGMHSSVDYIQRVPLEEKTLSKNSGHELEV